MNYFRSFLLNALIVFFIDRISPGIEITYYEQVPNIGADLLFAMITGFLNASVFPFLAILDLNPTKLKIGIITAIISYSCFIVISIVPFGVNVVSPIGVLFGGTVVWAVAFIANILEFKRDGGGLK